MRNFVTERFSLKELNEVESKQEYRVEIYNWLAALENIHEDVEISEVWENISENINISDQESVVTNIMFLDIIHRLVFI
jgi:hypothetical protein